MRLESLVRPEYALHPSQVLRRLRREKLLREDSVRLAWGLPVSVTRGSRVGDDILNHGVSDKIVPETIWRLLDPGENAVDAGANLGQNTSMMAVRSGGGAIHAFEPHPELYVILRKNVLRWRDFGAGGVRVVQAALSSSPGIATLHEGYDLGGNSLEPNPPDSRRPAVPRSFQVEVTTLDTQVGGERPALLKIDVEGHEAAVLEGASQVLATCRDVIFEDFHPQPATATRILMGLGFTVLGLYPTWRGPLMRPLSRVERDGPAYTVNFLATRQPRRAAERMRPRGWHCLRTLVGTHRQSPSGELAAG